MTTKELQTLVEQIAAHTNTLAQLQITTSQLVNEGLRATLADTKALLELAGQHEDRLNNHQRRLDELDGGDES